MLCDYVTSCDCRYQGLALNDSDVEQQEGANPFSSVGNDADKEDMLMFLGFPSCKDPSFKDRFPGKSTCEIISTAHPEWFERFFVNEQQQEGLKKAGVCAHENNSPIHPSTDHLL